MPDQKLWWRHRPRWRHRLGGSAAVDRLKRAGSDHPALE
jgi:hypothetical protein